MLCVQPARTRAPARSRRALLPVALLLALALAGITPAMARASQPAVTVAASAGPIYWGALIDAAQYGLPSVPRDMRAVDVFESHAGKKVSLIHFGQSWRDAGVWQQFPTSMFDNVRSHGTIPLWTWASRDSAWGSWSEFQNRAIYGGAYDSYIRQWAGGAKAWGHPFFLRFDWEQNGWWYPWAEGKTGAGAIVNGNSAGDFVKMWRHVHDLFVEVGATNVTWVWCPNHYSTSAQYPPLGSLYPGDSYVDWTCFDAYNRYPGWLGFDQTVTGSGTTWLRNTYQDILAVAPSKPIMLAEFASKEDPQDGQRKAGWIADALLAQLPVNFPALKAIVWFNWNNGDDTTLAIESSAAAQAAFAQAIASPYYTANQFASIDASPIPPPGPAATLGLTPLADTSTTSASPQSTAGGTCATLVSDGDPVAQAFLRFDLTALAGKQLASATLRIKTASSGDAGSIGGHSVRLVGDTAWKEAYMSYNNSVAISSIVVGSIPANTAPGAWYEIGLRASDLQPKVGRLLSVAITTTSADGLVFMARESADPPQLLLATTP